MRTLHYLLGPLKGMECPRQVLRDNGVLLSQDTRPTMKTILGTLLHKPSLLLTCLANVSQNLSLRNHLLSIQQVNSRCVLEQLQLGQCHQLRVTTIHHNTRKYDQVKYPPIVSHYSAGTPYKGHLTTRDIFLVPF